MGTKGQYGSDSINDIRNRLGFLERRPDKKAARKTVNWKALLVIFIIGVAVGFSFKSCNRIINTEYITTTDTIYQDTGTHTVELIPQPIYIHKVDSVYFTTIPIIDTAEILKDYFATRGYSDTIVNDTSLTISYAAVVNRNQLQGIKFKYSNNRSTAITNNTTIIDQGKRFWIGANVGGNTNRFDVSPRVAYQKKRLQYSLEYGVYQKEVRVGVMVGF